MGNIEVQGQTINTSFVWLIKDFVNYTLEDEMLVATGKIKLREGQQEWSMVLQKNKSHLNFSIKNTGLKLGNTNTNKGKITLAILTPNLNRTHEYSTVLDIGKESGITFLLENLTGDNTVLFYKRHLLLSGTTSFTTPATTDENSCFSMFKEMSSLRLTLSALLESGTFHDFTIVVKNKNFPCHKAILACRSKYFRFLFKERKKIRNMLFLDTEQNILELILTYIYTGEVKITEDNVLQLLDASKKFSLARLTDICETKLMSYFSFQNALKMLDVSSAYDLENLKELALCFITAFAEDIQINSKDTSQNSVNQLEANKDPTKTNRSETNISKKTKTLHQQLDLTESPITTLGGKPYLPAVNVWYTEESRVIFRESWEFNIYEKENEWKIKDFTDDESTSTFKLSYILRKGITNGDKKECYFEFRLKITSSPIGFATIRYNISFANKNDEDTSMVFEGHKDLSQNYYFNSSDPFLQVNLEDIPISDGGTVSLKCTILFKDSFCHEFKQSISNRDDLISDISTLDRDESFQDLEIRFGEENKFSCHKAIVLSLCPFLKRKMEENQVERVISLGDKEIPHFRKFLSFLYGNEIHRWADSLAWELLPCSHAFQMDDLRKSCEDVLVSHLNLEDALNAYDFSKKYDLLKLEEASIKFISNNFKPIIKANRSHELFNDSRLLRAILKQP